MRDMFGYELHSGDYVLSYTGWNKKINLGSVDRNSFSVFRVNGTNSGSVFLLPYDLFGTGVDVNLGIFSTEVIKISEDCVKKLGDRLYCKHGYCLLLSDDDIIKCGDYVLGVSGFDMVSGVVIGENSVYVSMSKRKTKNDIKNVSFCHVLRERNKKQEEYYAKLRILFCEKYQV